MKKTRIPPDTYFQFNELFILFFLDQSSSMGFRVEIKKGENRSTDPDLAKRFLQEIVEKEGIDSRDKEKAISFLNKFFSKP